MTDLRPLSEVDPQVAALIGAEVERQRTNIHLIACENFVSRAVMQASGSVLSNKYSEGYPGKRYYEGCEVDRRDREPGHGIGPRRCSGPSTPTCRATAAPRPTWRSTSACCKPGDKVLGMRLDQGGHLTHGSPVNFSGHALRLRRLRRRSRHRTGRHGRGPPQGRSRCGPR